MTYDAKRAEAVLTKLAEGLSLRKIAKLKDMPAKSTFLVWCHEDEDLAKLYVKARAEGWQTMAEITVEKAKAAKDPHRGRLAFDADRWYLAKMNPKVFGDKQTHEVTGDGGGAVLTRIELVGVMPSDDRKA